MLENDIKIPSMEIPLAELSSIVGVSLRTGQRLSQSGVFVSCATKGKAGKKYYRLDENIQNYIEYVRKSYEDKDTGEEDLGRLKSEKLQAEVNLKRSQGELHRLKTDLARGQYISVDDVKLDYEKFFVIFKKFAMALPPRLIGSIAGYVDQVVCRGIERDLQKEVSNMLRSFVVAGHAEAGDGEDD